MSIVKINQDKLKEVLNRNARLNREEAYKKEADPLHYKFQRGEISKEEWEAKVEEIRNKFPYVS